MFNAIKMVMPRTFAVVIVLIAWGSVSSQATDTSSEDVPHRSYPADKPLLCHPLENSVVTAEQFEMIFARDDCRNALIPPVLDSERHSLISYAYKGSCGYVALVGVRRKDAGKVYVVTPEYSLKRCVTEQPISGWILIGKMKEDYKLDFEVNGAHISGPPPGPGHLMKIEGQQSGGTVQTKPFITRDCIPIFIDGRMVLNSRGALDRAIRDDAGRAQCLELFKDLTLDQNTLIGISVNSGYCGKPDGFAYRFRKSNFARKDGKTSYDLTITYTDPEGLVCRALKPYVLWLLAPKLDELFEVRFDIQRVRTPQPNPT